MENFIRNIKKHKIAALICLAVLTLSVLIAVIMLFISRRSAEDKERLREIKQILLGNYLTLDDGMLRSGGGEWISPLGVGDGAASTLVLGVSHRSYIYESVKKNEKQVMFAAFKGMQNVGRGVTLETAPNAVACYVRSVLFRPVLLVFEKVKTNERLFHFELHAYCGRSISALLSVKRAVGLFDKTMKDVAAREE